MAVGHDKPVCRSGLAGNRPLIPGTLLEFIRVDAEESAVGLGDVSESTVKRLKKEFGI